MILLTKQTFESRFLSSPELSEVENIQGDVSETQIVINDDKNLLIVHPDYLVSPTKVADSCICPRRGVLSERVRSLGGNSATSYAAVIGNLKHTFVEVNILLFQRVSLLKTF